MGKNADSFGFSPLIRMKFPFAICLMLIGKGQLQCARIGRNTENWEVVSVGSALDGASATAYGFN